MLTFKPGIQPDSSIRAFIEAGAITLARPPAEGQIQPASLDLRLGARAYRVRASFLPGPERTVRASISFPEQQYQFLEKIAEENKVSLAWVVRDAIDSYLKSKWPLLPQGANAKDA